MLTELYIQALLVDEELADQVWHAWDMGEIGDRGAWWTISNYSKLIYTQFEKGGSICQVKTPKL